MTDVIPTTTGDNGRSADGRFCRGNRLATGNPHAKRVARLRSAILRAITPDDVREVIAALVQQAKAGDVAAAKVLLDRIFGRPKLEVEVSSSQSQLSIEQRRLVVLESLGIETAGPRQLSEASQ